MSLFTHKSSFAANTSIGTQVVTGCGFQPKVVLFVVTNQTAEGFAAGQHLSVGWMAGLTQQNVCAIASDDAVVLSNAGTYQNTGAAIQILSNGTPTTTSGGGFSSFDADGFTFSWSSAPASAWIIHYLALGGSDLTNVKIGQIDCPASTGNTGHTGFGFQPDCVLFLSALRPIPSSTSAVGTRMMLGAAKSSTERAVTWAGEADNALPTNSWQGQRTNRCVMGTSATATTIEADLVSMDSDGLTLNWSTVTSGRTVFYLALKGGRYKVGAETQKTSTGTKATTGLGLSPTGLLLWGANAVANSALDTTQQRLSIGAGDGTTEGSVWTSAQDASTPVTDTNQSTTTGKVLRHATNPSTTNAEADLTLDIDGFTLDWTTADATAREFLYLAMGPVPQTGAVALAGDGAVQASGLRSPLGASSLVGDGSLQMAGVRNALGAAALAGEGQSVLAALRAALGAASLSGESDVVAAAIRYVIASALLSGDGALTTSAIARYLGSAALAGEGVLAAAGIVGSPRWLFTVDGDWVSTTDSRWTLAGVDQWTSSSATRWPQSTDDDWN